MGPDPYLTTGMDDMRFRVSAGKVSFFPQGVKPILFFCSIACFRGVIGYQRPGFTPSLSSQSPRSIPALTSQSTTALARFSDNCLFDEGSPTSSVCPSMRTERSGVLKVGLDLFQLKGGGWQQAGTARCQRGYSFRTMATRSCVSPGRTGNRIASI